MGVFFLVFFLEVVGGGGGGLATFHSVLVRCGSVLSRVSQGSFLSFECGPFVLFPGLSSTQLLLSVVLL